MNITLVQRMVRYLENNDGWVIKKQLINKGRQAGYSYDDCMKAVRELKDIINIGIIYVSPTDEKSTLPGGEYYMYHKMTLDEQIIAEESLIWFENLTTQDHA